MSSGRPTLRSSSIDSGQNQHAILLLPSATPRSELRCDDAGEAGDQSGDRAGGYLQQGSLESIEAVGRFLSQHATQVSYSMPSVAGEGTRIEAISVVTFQPSCSRTIVKT